MVRWVVLGFSHIISVIGVPVVSILSKHGASVPFTGPTVIKSLGKGGRAGEIFREGKNRLDRSSLVRKQRLKSFGPCLSMLEKQLIRMSCLTECRL